MLVEFTELNTWVEVATVAGVLGCSLRQSSVASLQQRGGRKAPTQLGRVCAANSEPCREAHYI